jgi:hypothetical protein
MTILRQELTFVTTELERFRVYSATVSRTSHKLARWVGVPLIGSRTVGSTVKLKLASSVRQYVRSASGTPGPRRRQLGRRSLVEIDGVDDGFHVSISVVAIDQHGQNAG